MSKFTSKSSQSLASKQKKDGTEKRAMAGRAKTSGRPKGSKIKGAAKTRKTTTTPGRKPRGRPKKLEKEEEKGISQESSLKEQLPSGTGQL
uniref:High mobility group protein HMG-I/HMG-Y n=1 Tax=Colobus angolensis palliatus TaxID=336983 RepID=A0A2K5IJV0_COLAP